MALALAISLISATTLTATGSCQRNLVTYDGIFDVTSKEGPSATPRDFWARTGRVSSGNRLSPHKRTVPRP